MVLWISGSKRFFFYYTLWKLIVRGGEYKSKGGSILKKRERGVLINGLGCDFRKILEKHNRGRFFNT